MTRHVVFVAPFFLEATLRFLRGTLMVPDCRVSLVSQDPLDKLPPDIRDELASHWRVDDALDPVQLAEAAARLQERVGPIARMFGALEQLQVPLAEARRQLGIEGLDVETAQNFRDKARMKTVLREAGVPCARHALLDDPAVALRFAGDVGYPVIVKPPAGAGAVGTWRVDQADDLATLLQRFPPTALQPVLLEEFVSGTEHSFDSVMIDGQLVWHSISRYMPSPLDVLENPWIQWCVLLPRDIDTSEYDPIRAAATAGLQALGLRSGLSHMEWFRLADGRVVISEVGARPPGAQITSLLSYAYDTDFYRAWPELQVSGAFAPPERRFATGAAYVRGQGKGTVRAIHGLGEAQRRFGDLVVEARLPRAGQMPSSSYEGDGFVIVRHPDTRVVEEALVDIVKLVRVELA